MEDRTNPLEGFEVVGIELPAKAMVGLLVIEAVNRVATSMQRNLGFIEGVVLRIAAMSPEYQAEFEQSTEYTVAQLRDYALEIFAINIYYLDKVVADLDPALAKQYGTSAEDIVETNQMRLDIIEKMKERRDEFALATASPLGQDA